MARLLKTKRCAFLVFGLALVALAIVAGCGGRGGSSSASDRANAKAAGHWRAIADAPEPIAAGRTTVWTGSEMIVTGIDPGPDGTFADWSEVAEAYSPRTNAWRQLPAPPKTANYCKRDAVWTGTEMLVWGCKVTAYDPTTNQWRLLPDAPTRHGIVAWTGRELIGWGGGCCGDVSDDGSAYNPVTNTWRRLAPAPVSGQQSPVGAWTGRELVVFNGHSPEGARVGGAAYNPRTDSWRRIPSERRLSALRSRSTTETRSTWSARVRTPSSRSTPRTTAGGRCRGRSSAPTVSSPPGLGTVSSRPARRRGHTSRLPTSWRSFSSSPLEARQGAQGVWTGRELIVWGGLVPTPAGASTQPKYLVDGAAFSPPKYTPPPPECWSFLGHNLERNSAPSSGRRGHFSAR